MAGHLIPDWDRVALSSREEVVLSALEREPENALHFDAVDERQYDLGIGKGNHLHEWVGYLSGRNMVTHDFDFGRRGSYRSVRESVVTIGNLVRVYLLDAKLGQIAMLQGEKAVNPNNGAVHLDPISPPHVMLSSPQAVEIRVGEEFLEQLWQRANKVELVSSVEAAKSYLKDTHDFVLGDTATVQHTQLAAVRVVPVGVSWVDEASLTPPHPGIA